MWFLFEHLRGLRLEWKDYLSLLFVCSPGISKSAWKLFGFSIVNNITDSIYWYATGKISSFLNKLQKDALGSAPDIILITLFCDLKTLQLSAALP
jgi:hypothetical protein